MALRDIIETVSFEVGFGTSAEDRGRVLNLINRAAKEVYESDDLPGCLIEQVFYVLTDGQTVLPYTVGDIRAMREFSTGFKVELRDMSPRYSYNPWPTMWKGWRDKGIRALAGDITNAGPLFFQVGTIETPDPAIISITGETASGTCVTEDITIDNTTKQSLNAYTDVKSIQRHVPGIYDIRILDTNGVELGIIPNNMLRTAYRIMDLSEYPWSVPRTVSPYIEILYKQRLPKFYNDADEFPCPDYDDAIALKACELFFHNQKGMKEQVKTYFDRAQQAVNNTTMNKNAFMQKRLTFGPNPLHYIIPPRLTRQDYVTGMNLMFSR